jgi:2-amino-4-hydroxy-6-hydroxymethyldihydropteridine diphosphokinase
MAQRFFPSVFSGFIFHFHSLTLYFMLSYIALGSNLGNKFESCRRAIAAVRASEKTRILRCSSFYRTEPVGKKDQDWFLNGVMAVETLLRPRELLDFLLAVEEGLGRERRERWGPRVIDLDILFYGGEVIQETGLKIPHPRLQDRRFVLVPLHEIAPDLVHPVLRRTVTELLSTLQEGDQVLPVPEEESRKLCSA